MSLYVKKRGIKDGQIDTLTYGKTELRTNRPTKLVVQLSERVNELSEHPVSDFLGEESFHQPTLTHAKRFIAKSFVSSKNRRFS